MERTPATSQQQATDRDEVDRALLSLARLLGEAAAAEMRDETPTHEAAADDPQDP